jgi:hypothetical protein
VGLNVGLREARFSSDLFSLLFTEGAGAAREDRTLDGGDALVEILKLSPAALGRCVADLRDSAKPVSPSMQAGIIGQCGAFNAASGQLATVAGDWDLRGGIV